MSPQNIIVFCWIETSLNVGFKLYGTILYIALTRSNFVENALTSKKVECIWIDSEDLAHLRYAAYNFWVQRFFLICRHVSLWQNSCCIVPLTSWLPHFMFPAHNCGWCISILACKCARYGSSFQSANDLCIDRSLTLVCRKSTQWRVNALHPRNERSWVGDTPLRLDGMGQMV